MKFSYLFLQPKTSLQSYQRFDTRFKIEFDPHEWNKNYKDHNAFTIHFIGHWKTSGDHKMIWNSQTRHVFNTDIFLFVYLFIFFFSVKKRNQILVAHSILSFRLFLKRFDHKYRQVTEKIVKKQTFEFSVSI